mmetsp:Transcript_21732/g.74702  ORF Transcript_21732/g.74702 Transcript_21732/m.74702 type:complete len:311 (+) Transcript_21732:227-1159(+)
MRRPFVLVHLRAAARSAGPLTDAVRGIGDRSQPWRVDDLLGLPDPHGRPRIEETQGDPILDFLQRKFPQGDQNLLVLDAFLQVPQEVRGPGFQHVVRCEDTVRGEEGVVLQGLEVDVEPCALLVHEHCIGAPPPAHFVELWYDLLAVSDMDHDRVLQPGVLQDAAGDADVRGVDLHRDHPASPCFQQPRQASRGVANVAAELEQQPRPLRPAQAEEELIQHDAFAVARDLQPPSAVHDAERLDAPHDGIGVVGRRGRQDVLQHLALLVVVASRTPGDLPRPVELHQRRRRPHETASPLKIVADAFPRGRL